MPPRATPASGPELARNMVCDLLAVPSVMVREAEALARKQRFILCRYLLILVTGALGYLETMQDGSPMPITALMTLAIFSNLYLGTVSPFSFFDATMQAPVLVSDTAMVSAVLSSVA